MNNFTDLVTLPALRNNLVRQSFKTPTPIQAEAIPPALAGHDVVATAQTGTGKTLAFSLPIIELLSKRTASNKPQALILSPTRELAMQIDAAFNLVAHGTGIKTAVVVGGMSEAKQIQQIRRGARVIIATPGRLSDFMERNLVSLDEVSIVVLDEADRMLDMGFLPAVEAILRRTAKERQTLFFSATFEGGSVERLIGKYLKNPVRIAIGETTRTADKVELRLYEVEQYLKLGMLTVLLENEQGSFLVFSRTKHGAEKLAKKLTANGAKATAIHGDRSQNQRNQALKGFQEGYYRVLVATDVAARGIHVDGISHVVNYDLPQAPDDFIHRVGRTGRAGAEGVAITFATSGERGEIRNIERTLKLKLKKMETPVGLPREERSAKVIEIPRGQQNSRPSFGSKPAFGSKAMSFKPRRRGFASAR